MENAVCHFVFYTGPRKGDAQVFNTARVSIGRASNCDFRLEAFHLDEVAPHHAELLLEEGTTWCIYDLGTKSGTFVNGERVHERCALMNEDYLRFGQDGPELIFRTGTAAPGRQQLPEVFPVTAELEFFSGSDAGRIFPINASIASNIGRRADLEVPLDPRGDMIVSGNHCNIRFVNGHFVITDTSRNGTYVNNELVDQPLEILDGDVIMMGDGGPQARFHVDEAKRHYPNHRALSPVTKKQEAKATSSFQGTPAGIPTPPAVLSSAKPFLSGSAVPPAGAAAAASAATNPLGPENSTPADSAAASTPTAPSSIEGEPVFTPELAPSESVSDLPDFMKELSPEDISSASDAAMPQTVESETTADVAPLADLPVADPATEAPKAAPAAPTASDDEIPATRSGGGEPGLAAVPKPPRTIKPGQALPFSRKQLMIGGGIAALLLLIIIIAVSGGDDETATTGAARGNYAAALQETKPVENAAGLYTVQVPDGWATLNRDSYVSIESADKDIAIDYVRDPRADEVHLMQLLQKDGATVAGSDTIQVQGNPVTVTHTAVGNVRRAGALVPTGSTPVMVVMEATEDAMERLPKDGLENLLAKNITATGAVAVPTPAAQPAQPAAAPDAAPTPGASLPTPAAAQPQPDVPTETAQTETTSPEAAPVETAAADTGTSPTGPTIESKALQLSLAAPAGWKGASEEADEMIMLSDNDGLVIRIARDPGDLDAAATFEAMEEEGWKSEGVKNTSRYHAGEFSGKDQNLMLVLIPEKAKTTLLIYATSPKDFTEAQRYGIRDILVQLVPQ